MNIVVVGLGSVGLPMAVWLANKGYSVLGVDLNKEHIKAINLGQTDLLEVVPGDGDFSTLLRDCLHSNSLTVTSEYQRMSAGEHIFLVTVGIPVNSDGSCDYGPLSSCLANLVKMIRRGDLVMIKSTLVPGTMYELIIPALRSSGLIIGEDIAVAYCPERLAEGSALLDFDGVTRLVTAEDSFSLKRALAFWRQVSTAECIPLQTYLIAELAKVLENLHRDANIALSNELFPLVNQLGLEFGELEAAVNTHPRVKMLSPGAGVGGHCLPNALYYLVPVAARYGIPLDLGKLARKINANRPEQVAQSAIDLCRSLRGEVGPMVILGVGMKDNCADTRYSPALDLARILQDQGVEVRLYDPVVYETTDDLQAVLAGATAAIVTAYQSGMGSEEILAAIAAQEKPPLLLDSRGKISKIAAAKLGVEVYYV